MQDKTMWVVLHEQGKKYQEAGLSLVFNKTDIIALAVLEKLGVLDQFFGMMIDSGWHETSDGGYSIFGKTQDNPYGVIHSYQPIFYQSSTHCELNFYYSTDLGNPEFRDTITNAVHSHGVEAQKLQSPPYVPIGWNEKEHKNIILKYEENVRKEIENGIGFIFPSYFIEQALAESSIYRAMTITQEKLAQMSIEEKNKVINGLHSYLYINNPRPPVKEVRSLANLAIVRFYAMHEIAQNSLNQQKNRTPQQNVLNAQNVTPQSTALTTQINKFRSIIEAEKEIDIRASFMMSEIITTLESNASNQQKAKKLESYIEDFQVFSELKTIQNILTTFAIFFAIATIVGIPIAIYVLHKNHKDKGDAFLFWTNAPKQATQETIHLLNSQMNPTGGGQ